MAEDGEDHYHFAAMSALDGWPDLARTRCWRGPMNRGLLQMYTYYYGIPTIMVYRKISIIPYTVCGMFTTALWASNGPTIHASHASHRPNLLFSIIPLPITSNHFQSLSLSSSPPSPSLPIITLIIPSSSFHHPLNHPLILLDRTF